MNVVVDGGRLAIRDNSYRPQPDWTVGNLLRLITILLAMALCAVLIPGAHAEVVYALVCETNEPCCPIYSIDRALRINKDDWMACYSPPDLPGGSPAVWEALP